MFAIKDANKPKALINKPTASKAFIFNKVIVKYINMMKFIICENIESASPVFILS